MLATWALFPDPDSPKIVEISPRRSWNEIPFTTWNALSIPLERDGEIAGIDDGVAAHIAHGAVSVTRGSPANAPRRYRSCGRRQMITSAFRRRQPWLPVLTNGLGELATRRKRQPDGGFNGLGGSPLIGTSVVRRRGSKVGMLLSSARV